MAYYLTVKNKNNFDIIDITKSYGFKKFSTYAKEGACSLKEIDNFTLSFPNEDKLKRQLYLEGIMSSEQCFKNLTIRIKSRDNYKKVMYDALYKDDAGHLVCNQNKIDSRSLIKDEVGELSVGKIILEYLKKVPDTDFLEKFVRTFYNYYDCRLSINDLGCYVSESKRTGIRSRYFESTLIETLYSLSYSYDKETQKRVKNYKNIHTLAAFLVYQDKKNNIHEEDNNSKPKKRIKQNPNQISLFDLE